MKKRIIFPIVILLVIVIGLLYWRTGIAPEKNKEVSINPATLKVTAIFPMTGPGASIGTYLNNGIQLAMEEIKTRYKGRLKMNVDIIDSKNQPKEATTALLASIARTRPDAVISALSSVSSAIKPVVEQQGILTIATTTALSGLPQGSSQIVRIYPTSDNFVRPVAEYMAARFQRMGVLYIHDDFGISNFKIFSEICRAEQKEIVGAESYELLQQDTRTVVAKVLSSSPEAVFVVGYGPSYIKIFKQLREQAPNLPIFADLSFPNPAVLHALGKDAEGVIFDGTDAELTEPETRLAAEFRKRYGERFGQEPFMVAGFAYDSLMIIAEASLRKDSFKAPDKSAIIAISPFHGIMGTIYLDQAGESNIPLKLMTLRNGAIVSLNHGKHE